MCTGSHGSQIVFLGIVECPLARNWHELGPLRGSMCVYQNYQTRHAFLSTISERFFAISKPCAEKRGQQTSIVHPMPQLVQDALVG